MTKIRVRFAPSPTGNLHIGSVRTALFNWVYAKHFGGECVLRIEDTDLQRSEEKFEKNIIEGLHWLGLEMDESPEKSGNYGPYQQSKRIQTGIYQKYIDRLVEKGLAYPCFETNEELEAERALADSQGIPYKYSQKSLQYSKEEVDQKLAAKLPHTYRFRMPASGEIEIPDMIRGAIRFDANLLSDFVLMKSDGSPAYNFAVVVDDIEMNITHVIRGEDHISNTARQILLFQALGVTLPEFAHLPIILGPDRSKLSKRHGAQAVTDYQNEGYLPEALINYLSLLGWSPPTEKEIMSRDELVSAFTVDRISKSGAIFDVTKLKWMNGQYIRALSKDDLFRALHPFIDAEKKKQVSEGILADMCVSIKDNLEVLSQINEYLAVYFLSDADYQKGVKDQFAEDQIQIIKAFQDNLGKNAHIKTQDDWQKLLSELVAELQMGKGKVFKSIRVASTGLGTGPDLIQALVILGPECIQERLKRLLTHYD